MAAEHSRRALHRSSPNRRYFDWTVPNTPTNAAVLDVRFGCEMYYPETYSPQPASTFVIAQHAADDTLTSQWQVRREDAASIPAVARLQRFWRSCSFLRELVDLQDGAQELGEILAVAGGVIKRVQPRIHCRFGQRDAE